MQSSGPGNSANLYDDEGLFTYTETGFAIATPSGSYPISWLDIQALFGYKRDLYAYDLVYLDIFLVNGLNMSIHEQIPGWHYFARRLTAELPDITSGWEINLTFPPFEANFTLLYERAGLLQAEAISTYYQPEPGLKTKIAAWLKQLFRKIS
ncbi:MAG: hypothetical protein EOO56_14335 [Hymenobacter sp.]|nr:MAG: hypothetical protein EOO56_14335 [Hymenobacter sp.]